MAVYDDVDVVLLEDAEVDLAPDRFRRTEEYVAEIGADHGPAPSVPHGGPETVHEEIRVIGVDSLVGPVKRLDDVVLDSDG